jgi:multiple sugar transport system ATP-binding protein
MAEVMLRKVVKRYDEVEAVRGIDLDIADHEFVVLVGPSGCGKSTTLRMIAGLEDITDGDIMIGGDVVNDVPPKDRDIAMVFQNYALYPHMTVAENMSFGLRLKRYPKAEIKTRIDEAARMLDIVELVDRKPKQLSGGQRQRVAMGRAIVRNPKVFLFDEPLSNLDAKLRVQMRIEIKKVHQKVRTTTVYVTHDQVEAMTLGHRVAVMKKGVLQQIAPPQELYDKPDNLFVAGFIGSPAMNFLPSTLEKDGDGAYSVTAGAESLTVPPEVVAAHPLLAKYAGRSLVVGFRPEDMQDASLVPGGEGRTLSCFAELVEPLGSDLMVHLTVDIPPVQGNEDVAELAKESGDTMFAREGKAALVARFNPRSPVKEQEKVAVTIDTSRLHFFDAHSGLAIRDEQTQHEQEDKQ